MKPFNAVIPARFASTRLPGKPLRELAGKTMLEHAWIAARSSQASVVVIATDDQRIYDKATELGAEVLMTRSDHASGSDRIAEVAKTLGWDDQIIVVNVQCDEPMLPPALINQVAATLSESGDLATLAVPFEPGENIEDPNVVKLVQDEAGRALYFSRSPIPYDRDQPGSSDAALRHLGLYAYRVGSLKKLCALPQSKLEKVERLEQLRALEAGMQIDVGLAAASPGPGVDTEDDLIQAGRLMERAK